ncbi:amyloid-beta A4 precursor protein-binding family A member 2 isoform X2 [Brachyhypopomus gauderio]|uniref:amyloid-beta A4 precursor protein-binding family A member 2 isoform X2 n=1 Tax=Brachyhypopomus gauderio TaxID=698409 RepID=UPI0040431010
MAQRKRLGAGNSMASGENYAPAPCPCPAPYPSNPADHTQEGYEEQQDPEPSAYCEQEGAHLPDSRPATPPAPDHAHPDYCGRMDSLDGDSSSDYVNNTSEDEEEDYDEGLPEEDEGVTYYIRYCPEDDSYLEGVDCNEGGYERSDGRGEPPHGADDCQEAVEEWAEGEGIAHGEVRCEVLEQDSDPQIYDGRPEPVLDHHPHPHPQNHPPHQHHRRRRHRAHHHHHHHPDPEHDPPSSQAREPEREEEDGEGSEDYCPDEGHEPEEEREGDAYAGDYYPPEDNGNVPLYAGRKGVEGETGEETEEDIDQIVAEIKMSMSVGSLSSSTDQSPEELATDPPPAHQQPEAPPKAEPAPYPPPHRHDGRPKSLNIPPVSGHNPPLQRGPKGQSRTPEERRRWTQEHAREQVSNSAEQPRKQQRSDLNGPLENNNLPEPSKKAATFPSFVDVPGPCEPEDLIDGIIFAANYLGSTQLLSERNPSKNIRMMQAQEAVSRVKRVQKAAKIKKKSSEGDAQTLTEVDLFISTQRIKVLNADSQEAMMDNALRTISYIADIGNIVVLMARRRMPRSASQDCIETTPGAPQGKKQYKMICHVFESEDAQLIAQSIGQAFSVAYQEFLRANGINPEDLSQKEYSDIINTQEMYNDDLVHFSNSENCKELHLEKQKGEILGVVIVESGWGSILPTVILANMMNGGPAARSGKLSIGDQIMSINNTSLVGLPLATCQGIIKGLKNQVHVKLNIVSCPPVTTVLIKRPDLKYQLGFSVQNGIICSLMRGGIAERGGVRVGHRIIEINSQSVVATAHEKIVQALSNSVGEIHMKTMPAAMFRLLTGQETPMYI